MINCNCKAGGIDEGEWRWFQKEGESTNEKIRLIVTNKWPESARYIVKRRRKTKEKPNLGAQAMFNAV